MYEFEHGYPPTRIIRIFKDTGFIPCLACESRGEDVIRAEIIARRECPTPFPDYG